MTPIIIRRPIMTLQELDANGDPVGTAVDVSPDVGQVTLTPSLPSTTVTTFAGKFTAIDDPEWGTATVAVIVNADTEANWAPLVGESVEVKIYDRAEHADPGGSFRRFVSEVVYNPALAGQTQPGNPRGHDFPLPVLSAVTLETVPAI